jgi:glycosyltransferase involved in cell wall biosynthesis
VLGQTFRDMEVIVVNDASTDDSLEVIKPYLSDDRVRLVDHDANRGAVASLIHGAEESRGKYITVVSADDWIVADDAFERQIALLEAHPNAAFAFGAFGIYFDENHLDGVVRPVAETACFTGIEALERILLGDALQASGTIIRADAYREAGGYRPDVRFAFDTRMWIDLCAVGGAISIDDELGAYRQHGSNMTASPDTARRSIEEKFLIVDDAIVTLRRGGHPRADHVAHRALQKTGSEWMIQYLFQRDDVRTAWRYFVAAVKVRPMITIAQPATLKLLARTVLGRRLYERAQRLPRPTAFRPSR